MLTLIYTVFLERVTMGTICPGNLVTYTCAVDDGILSWQDGNGNPLGTSYLASTSVGSIQSVNGFTFNLTSVVINNLISTATITPATSGIIALRCTNALGGTNSSSVNVRSSELVFLCHGRRSREAYSSSFVRVSP